MSNVKDLSPVAQLVIDTTKNKGVSFASLVYTKENGEVSQNTVNINATLSSAKAKDVVTLQALTDKDFDVYGDDKAIMIEAKDALIQSYTKPNENRSNGQIDAYTIINSAMKYHNVTGDLYLFALNVKKTVLIEGKIDENKKPVKSAPLTLAKRKVEKDFKLKNVKYVSYRLDRLTKVSLNGDTLVFE